MALIEDRKRFRVKLCRPAKELLVGQPSKGLKPRRIPHTVKLHRRAQRSRIEESVLGQLTR